MARARRVFNNHELPHQWAHSIVPEGRNANGTFYFEGDTIYSYGSHFPIARLVNQADGGNAVLVTDRTYSVTTTQHTSRAVSSVPSSYARWYVDDPHTSPTDSFEKMRQTSRGLAGAVADAQNKVSRAKRYSKLEAHVEYSNRFADAFGVASERLTLPAIEGIQAEIAALREREEKAAKKLAKKHAKEYAERERIARLEMAEQAELWRAGDSSVSYLSYRFPDTLLRIKGGVVETSRGVEFPIRHAIRGLNAVERVRASRQEWRRNGENIRLGHYMLDSIDANGDVHAGCHFVRYEEIARIASALRQLAGVASDELTERAV